MNAIGNFFDNLVISSLYILNHSTIAEVGKKYFNIYGSINNKKPKFEKTNIIIVELEPSPKLI